MFGQFLTPLIFIFSCFFTEKAWQNIELGEEGIWVSLNRSNIFLWEYSRMEVLILNIAGYPVMNGSPNSQYYGRSSDILLFIYLLLIFYHTLNAFQLQGPF